MKGRETSISLLPNLCLANYEMGHEVTSFLFTTSEARIETIDSVQSFMAQAHKFKLTNLLDHIRKIYLPYVNIQLRFPETIMPSKHDPQSLDLSSQRVIESNKAHYALIASCKRIRELRLKFCDHYYLADPYVELIVRDEQFDIQSVLGCKELEKVEILGIGHSKHAWMLMKGESILLRLRSTREIGRGITEGFKTQGREVEVRVFLRYAGGRIDLQEGEVEDVVNVTCW
jgi:hypothetical protein